MTTLFDKARRAAAVLLFVLSGCGPGVGGTGTGAVPVDVNFSGSVADAVIGSVCQTQQCNVVTLALRDARVELVGGCVRFVFEGSWPRNVSDVVVAGTLETRGPTGVVSSPGSLQLRFAGADAASAPYATVFLRDGNGTLLMGPTVLARGDAAALPAEPAGCGAP
jgi:hypothetical protein